MSHRPEPRPEPAPAPAPHPKPLEEPEPPTTPPPPPQTIDPGGGNGYELKSRLSSYLQGNSDLEGFRVWLATVLRNMNALDESARELVGSVDFALASFCSGRVSLEEMRKELERILNQPDTGKLHVVLNLGKIQMGTVGEPHQLASKGGVVLQWATSSNFSTVRLAVAETNGLPPAWVISEVSSQARTAS